MSHTRAPGWVFATSSSAGRTMARMARQVRDCVAHSPLVIQTANDIVANVPRGDALGMAEAIGEYVQHHFRYISDPVGVELLRDPGGGLSEIKQRGYTQGDCDEGAMLSAALGIANGLPARFRALAFYSPKAPYTHVVCDLHAGSQWVPLDVTKPATMELPPHPTRTLYQMV